MTHYIFRFTHTNGTVVYHKVRPQDYRQFANNPSYQLVGWPYP